MAASRRIEVQIIGDTRQIRSQFLRAELLFARGPIRRLRICYALWRISRERI